MKQRRIYIVRSYSFGSLACAFMFTALAWWYSSCAEHAWPPLLVADIPRIGARVVLFAAHAGDILIVFVFLDEFSNTDRCIACRLEQISRFENIVVISVLNLAHALSFCDLLLLDEDVFCARDPLALVDISPCALIAFRAKITGRLYVVAVAEDCSNFQRMTALDTLRAVAGLDDKRAPLRDAVYGVFDPDRIDVGGRIVCPSSPVPNFGWTLISLPTGRRERSLSARCRRRSSPRCVM